MRVVRKVLSALKLFCLWMFVIVLSGCPVPQPPGRGTQFLLRDPGSSRYYFLYLPAGYTPEKSWPMVVTLHGMKPFDTPAAQAREWQSTADKYGFIVVAPELFNSDLFMQYPLRNINRGVKEDEKNVISVLKYVRSRLNVDKEHIFLTCWSSGGYLMHYVANNNPYMFAAICSKGACFSEEVLSVRKAKIMKNRGVRVMITWGQNDMWNIQAESQRAVDWYRRLGFKVTKRVVRGKGHERFPEVAARFFAKYTGIVSRIPIVSLEASSTVNVGVLTTCVTAILHNVEERKLYRGYIFRWYLDDKLQSEGKGEYMYYTTIGQVGKHTIKVEVISPEGARTVDQIEVIVLPRKLQLPSG